MAGGRSVLLPLALLCVIVSHSPPRSQGRVPPQRYCLQTMGEGRSPASKCTSRQGLPFPLSLFVSFYVYNTVDKSPSVIRPLPPTESAGVKRPAHCALPSSGFVMTPPLSLCHCQLSLFTSLLCVSDWGDPVVPSENLAF